MKKEKQNIRRRKKTFKIVRYIYTPYVWFVGTYLILFIFFFQLIAIKFASPDKLYPFISRYFRFLLRALFIRIEVSFEEVIDTEKSYIFMPNHTSFFDVFISGAYIPVCVNALEEESHFKWFLYGKVIKSFGQIPISRKNVRKALKSYDIAKERLKNGRSIIVFPEGHRSEDGQVKRFKKIPFNFAKNADADLVPIGFIGVRNIRRGSKIWLNPSRIEVKFGKLITKEEIKHLTTEELMQVTRNKILNLVGQEE